MSKPMTISDERLEELEKGYREALDELGEENGAMLIRLSDMRKLLYLARVRRCEAAECDAWRRRGGWFGKITKTWFTSGSPFKLPMPEADATDAARRAAGLEVER